MGLSEYIDIAGVFIAIISLVVMIQISRIIPESERLIHRKHIREIVSKLAEEMKSGRNHMCKIIDIDRFETLYPDNFNSNNKHSYFKAELEGNDVHGVLFTDCLLGINEDKNGCYIADNNGQASQKAARCGLIPYNWIIDIDVSGDEIDTSAIFFCKFKKRKIRFGYYFIQEDDYSLKKKLGFYQDRRPFHSYRYYLLDNNKTYKYRQFVNVTNDKNAI